MSARGEPYSVAARRLGVPAEDASPAMALAACARATLDEPSARMAVRLVIDLPGVRTAGPRDAPGRGGVLGLGRKLLWSLLHDGTHVAGEGFAEPAAWRYMVAAGQLGGFVCRGEAVAQGRHGWRVRSLSSELSPPASLHWLWPLWALTGTVTAREVGIETVRGVACRQLAAEVDLSAAAAGDGQGWPAAFRPGPGAPVTAALAVWIGGRRVRRVRYAESGRGEVSPGTGGQLSAVTVELWDFGASTAHLDWSRFP